MASPPAVCFIGKHLPLPQTARSVLPLPLPHDLAHGNHEFVHILAGVVEGEGGTHAHLVAEGTEGGHYRDIPDKQRYYTWTNNIETFLESIKFKQARINLFKADALSFRLDEIMGLLMSIENNQPTVPVKKKERKLVETNKVFIVHGHNEAVKEKVARFVEHLKLEPIILHEQADQGRTIIEKFEANSADVNFAIVLLTADDEGKAKKETDYKERARQNVIFEMGYFVGLISRSHVLFLLEEGVEKPSDLDGIVYTSLNEDWKTKLFKELQACGYRVDPKDLVS